MAALPPGLVNALRACEHAVILTGAGISAESGIPTFRDPQQGMWARFRAEDLATPEAFRRDPELVWQWYQWRRELIAHVQPNPGHMALAALQRLLPHLTLITQNVDGLHQRAGSHDVIEFHGNIHRNRCSVENQRVEVPVAGTRRPPACPNCGAPVRPDVVWFGEPIPREALMAARIAAEDCDVFLSVGTSALVEPAASLARIAVENAACVVEINPGLTPASREMTFVLREPAGEVLPALVASLA